jgi:hypothetical protein
MNLVKGRLDQMKAEQQLDRVPNFLRIAGPIDDGNPFGSSTVSRVVVARTAKG